MTMAKSEDEVRTELDGLRERFIKAAPAVSEGDAEHIYGVLVGRVAGAFGMQPERLPGMLEEQASATGMTTPMMLDWWYMNVRLAQTATGRAILRHAGECMVKYEAALADANSGTDGELGN
jgi:hypothetical protein